MIANSQPALPFPLSIQTVTKINTQITKLYDKQTLNGKIKQVRLYENENINTYRKGTHLAVDKERINRVKEQLNLQLEGTRHALQRIKDDDLYANFTLNPFALRQQILLSERKPSSHQEQTDIFEGVERTKDKSKMAAIEERISRLKLTFYNTKSKAIIRDVAPIHPPPNQSAQTGQRITQMQQKTEAHFAFLDHLVKHRDERSLTLKFTTPKTNIFSLATGKFQKQFQNCRERLDMLHFCHESIVYNADSKQGVNIFMQMSLVSRKFITGRHQAISKEQRLLSSEMRTNIEKITFEDLMLASRGMLQANELSNYLHGNIEVTENEEFINLFYNSSKKKDQLPEYSPTQRHVCSLFEHESNNAYLQLNLKNFPFNNNEMKQLQLSKDLKQRMELILAQQIFLTSYGIKDERLWSQIKDKKIKIMNQQALNSHKATLTQKVKKNDFEIERRIRQSKLYKDRSENIKNKFIELTLREIKRKEKSLHTTGNPLRKKIERGQHSVREARKESSLDEYKGSPRRSTYQTEVKSRSVSPNSLKRDNRKIKEFEGSRYMKF